MSVGDSRVSPSTSAVTNHTGDITRPRSGAEARPNLFQLSGVGQVDHFYFYSCSGSHRHDEHIVRSARQCRSTSVSNGPPGWQFFVIFGKTVMFHRTSGRDCRIAERCKSQKACRYEYSYVHHAGMLHIIRVLNTSNYRALQIAKSLRIGTIYEYSYEYGTCIRTRAVQVLRTISK